MLSCFADLWNQELDPCTSTMAQLSSDNDACIDMLSSYITTLDLCHGNIIMYLQPPKLDQNLTVAEWLVSMALFVYRVM